MPTKKGAPQRRAEPQPATPPQQTTRDVLRDMARRERELDEQRRQHRAKTG